jgi:ribonuclease HI
VQVELITDGACGKKGDGGWAFVVYDGNDFDAQWGSAQSTTNQRMELKAALEGLRYTSLRYPQASVQVVSDSAYLVNCFKEQWYRKWMISGWRTSSGKDVKNTDLWVELLKLWSPRVSFTHVRGHAGHELNELADQLAVEARFGLR